MLEIPHVQWIAIVIIVIAAGGIGAVLLRLVRGYEQSALRALKRAYDGFEVRQQPARGDVVIEYHTYHGVIAWVTQSPHQVALPPEQARELLARLLRFNLTWGMTSKGFLFIPFLAIGTYLAQRRSISRQEARAAFALLGDLDDAPKVLAQGRRPSLMRRIFGGLMALMAATFGICGAIWLATGQLEAGGGGVILAGLLAWVACDWLKGPAARRL
jgi:hypothetical protein